MILSFDPPPDLVDLVWNAASAAAEVVGGITPLQVLGPFRTARVSAARSIAALLIRTHVWLERIPRPSAGREHVDVRMAITFTGVCPFALDQQGMSARLSTPMIGFLLGRDHSAVVYALRRTAGSTEMVDNVRRAEVRLAESYGQEPILMTVRVLVGRGRSHCTEAMVAP